MYACVFEVTKWRSTVFFKSLRIRNNLATFSLQSQKKNLSNTKNETQVHSGGGVRKKLKIGKLIDFYTQMPLRVDPLIHLTYRTFLLKI